MSLLVVYPSDKALLFWLITYIDWEVSLTRKPKDFDKRQDQGRRMSCTEWTGMETGKSRKTNVSASWSCPAGCFCHGVCIWPQLPPCENLRFGTWPSGFVQPLRRDLGSNIGVPMPLRSSCADFQLPLLLQPGPHPIDHATVMPPAQHRPSLLFSKTGIILLIFFPSPKIGKRREQLIWSSCWFCYLIKLFYSNSFFGFPSHLHHS